MNLQRAHPMSEEEGKSLTPYTFTIENVCNTTAYYQVNLEELESELKNLSNEYIKVSLNNSNGKILNTYSEVTPTIENATTSHKLTSGALKENDTKTYELRLWLDENTPPIEEVMSSTLKSKVTVIAVYKEDIENDLKIENKSLNEDFSNVEETIQFKGTSKNYNIIEYSEDNVIYNPVAKPSKEVNIQKTYTVDGTYKIYFKDEVGNVIESTIETTKLDQVDPVVNFTAEEYQDGIKVNASSSSDTKSGLKKYYYKLNDNDYIESTSSSYNFAGLADGDYKVTVKIEDRAQNYSEEKETSVTVAYEYVYLSNTGNDGSGNGSESKPYATLQRAYNKVKSGGEMVLLSDITATSTTNMNIENKEVTLKSNEENIYTIFRGNAILNQIIDVSNSNTLTTTKIIMDGKNINANSSLIEVHGANLNLNDTILQNNIHLGKYCDDWKSNAALGGGLYGFNSNINIVNSKIINNKINYTTSAASNSNIPQGGGIYIHNSTLNLYDGTIINGNSSNGTFSCQGGGIRSDDSVLNIYNVTITNNSALSFSNYDTFGGGICMYNSTMYWKGGKIENNTASKGPNTYIGNSQIIDER